MIYATEREPQFEIRQPEFDFTILSPEAHEWAKRAYEIGRITDEEVQNPLVLRDKREDYETAAHEIGHKRVAEALGWNVALTTIIPRGRARGMTLAFPPENRPVDRLIREKMAICYGGFYGEKSIGHTDHRGCGSDMAQVAFLNQQMGNFSRSEQLSAVSQVQAIAVGALGEVDIEREAWELTIQKEMYH